MPKNKIPRDLMSKKEGIREKESRAMPEPGTYDKRREPTREYDAFKGKR